MDAVLQRATQGSRRYVLGVQFVGDEHFHGLDRQDIPRNLLFDVVDEARKIYDAGSQ